MKEYMIVLRSGEVLSLVESKKCTTYQSMQTQFFERSEDCICFREEDGTIFYIPRDEISYVKLKGGAVIGNSD